jgi:hypothetical protein
MLKVTLILGLKLADKDIEKRHYSSVSGIPTNEKDTLSSP